MLIASSILMYWSFEYAAFRIRLGHEPGHGIVWLFAGCRTYGTQAAIDALSDVETVYGLRKFGDSAFFEATIPRHRAAIRVLAAI